MFTLFVIIYKEFIFYTIIYNYFTLPLNQVLYQGFEGKFNDFRLEEKL